MIRCTAGKALPLLLASCLCSTVVCFVAMLHAVVLYSCPNPVAHAKTHLSFLIGMLSSCIQLLSGICDWTASFCSLYCLLCCSLYLQQQLLQMLHGTSDNNSTQIYGAWCREQGQSAVERIQSKEEVAGDGESLVGLVCLAAVHAHVCSQLGLDKKLTKTVLDLHHKVCCPALACPALACPALPCPALPCPALPCPARNQDCIVVIRRCLVLFYLVRSSSVRQFVQDFTAQKFRCIHRSACWNKLLFVMLYTFNMYILTASASQGWACLLVLDSCPSLCHCLVASLHAKTCGPHADSSLASILQSEHTPCQFLVPDAALSC